MTNDENVRPPGGIHGPSATVDRGSGGDDQEETHDQETIEVTCPYCRRTIIGNTEEEAFDDSQADWVEAIEEGQSGSETSDGAASEDATP